jgi:hypothetical protein
MVVKLQKPDKSPGEDGIVSEFYKHYWYLIGSVVREIFFYKKLFCESQLSGFCNFTTIEISSKVIPSSQVSLSSWLIFFPDYLINMRLNHYPILLR